MKSISFAVASRLPDRSTDHPAARRPTGASMEETVQKTTAPPTQPTPETSETAAEQAADMMAQEIALRRAELPPATSLQSLYKHAGLSYRFSAHATPARTMHWTQPESRSRLVIFATPIECIDDELVYIPLDELHFFYVGVPLLEDVSIAQTVHELLYRPAPYIFARLARGFAEFLGGTVEGRSVYEHSHSTEYVTPKLAALAALHSYDVAQPLICYVSVENLPDTNLRLGPARLAEVRR